MIHHNRETRHVAALFLLKFDEVDRNGVTIEEDRGLPQTNSGHFHSIFGQASWEKRVESLGDLLLQAIFLRLEYRGD